jgi:hypothetical protein
MTDPKVPARPRQLMMTFDSLRLRGMSAAERWAAVTALANLLAEVAAAPGGGDDEF